MTIICLNGTPIESKANDEMTFDQLVQQINAHQQQDMVVTQMLIDGIEVDAEDFSSRRVKRYAHIELYTKSKASLAFDCLGSCYRYINAIVEVNQLIVQSYQNSELGKANKLFLEMVELSELFIDLFTKVNHTLKHCFPKTFTKSSASSQVEATLLNILKQVYRAKENGDLIMLCDLLEYELTDNLVQWKQRVIPELEKLKDN